MKGMSSSELLASKEDETCEREGICRPLRRPAHSLRDVEARNQRGDLLNYASITRS
jgi:hypothetical protein